MDNVGAIESPVKKLHAQMVELLVLCEEMGISAEKNGLRGPEDKEAARQAIVRLYIFAENLHDLAHKAHDTTLLLSATKLRTLAKSILELLLVEGLSELFIQPASKLIVPG
jgi:hypothetical protein